MSCIKFITTPSSAVALAFDAVIFVAVVFVGLVSFVLISLLWSPLLWSPLRRLHPDDSADPVMIGAGCAPTTANPVSHPFLSLP